MKSFTGVSNMNVQLGNNDRQNGDKMCEDEE